MPVETGVWDNKERCIGSLWGDQHYELEYNCGGGVTAIYAPFQRRGRWGGKRYRLKKVFSTLGKKSDGWSVGFDVTDKKKTESVVVGAFSLLRASKMNLCMVTVLQEC